MLLGKRPRPAMRRTTSLTEITFDLGTAEEPQRPPGNPPPPQRHHQRPAPAVATRRQQQQLRQNPFHAGDGQPIQYPYHQYQRVWSMVSPRNPRRNSGEFAVEPAAFLRVCGLCKRQLGPGRDTYMYRGEIAFCSLECRQQQMNQDKGKEKCSLASMKGEPAGSPAAAAPEGAADGETVAAA